MARGQESRSRLLMTTVTGWGGASRTAAPLLLLGDGLDRDGGLRLRAALRVLHVSGLRREERVVLADSHVHAGMELRAALAHEDGPRVHQLSAEGLEAEALALGIAAVAGRAACFLVCHVVSLWLGDGVHTDLRVVLPMALGLLVVLAAAQLEDLHLRAAPVGDDGGGYLGPAHQGVTELHGVAVRDHEHLVQDNLSANVCRYLFYFDFLAGGNAILLAAGFYDRVHCRTPLCGVFRPRVTKSLRVNSL